ncbi:hypothetical protein GCM10009740_32090 [Terrabacter terrae]|uniref:CDP-alcohol phosphatidyltransferase n=1 Tax=Terrabacter terrae TaxID=318434 RepID=A0ABN2UHF1_9MICO
MFVAVLLALRRGVPRWFPVAVGLPLGVLLTVRLLDVALLAAFYRPFNPLTDWRYVGSAAESLGESSGALTAVLAVVVAGLSLTGLLVLTPLAVGRVARVVDRHRRPALRAVVVASVAWVLCASSGLHTSSDLAVASSSTAGLAAREVTSVREGLRDMEAFAAQIPVDSYGHVPPGDLLGALRGKDVLVVFVESYGRVAVEESPEVAGALTAGASGLRSAGYTSRSAWLTSPTFGGISWLAHSTLESGLWVSSPQRYDQLLATGSSDRPRLTLARAFSGAGWRTVDVIPANHRDWPEGKAFYGYEQVYDARNLGYAGPDFGYAPMPDQYTLSAFDRLELERRPGRARQPVMAEMDLVTSHVPWAPLPHVVDWPAVGDGSIYAAQAAKATTPDTVWASPRGVRTAYGQSVAYSLDSIVSFLRSTHDRNLVVVMLGDHQPVSIVSGDHADHDVPVSVIARDPAVLEHIAGWDWQAGLRPGPAAPVWPMDRFRDRFLSAYSPDNGG